MKRRKHIILVIAILALILVSPTVYGVNLELGTFLDDVSVKELNGKDLQISQFRGKVVLITFWSTWCNRCREELTFLNENFRNIEDLVIIAINQDSDKMINRKRVEKFVVGIGDVDFKVAVDNGYRLWERFGINALPTSIILDREGKVTHIEPNFYFDSPDNIRKAIGDLMVGSRI
jgi:peroxiredoxin